MTDDRPLPLADIGEGDAPLMLLADRIVADQQAKGAAASEQEQDGSAEGNSNETNETEETQTA